jgi:hypothetical protein
MYVPIKKTSTSAPSLGQYRGHAYRTVRTNRSSSADHKLWTSDPIETCVYQSSGDSLQPSSILVAWNWSDSVVTGRAVTSPQIHADTVPTSADLCQSDSQTWIINHNNSFPRFPQNQCSGSGSPSIFCRIQVGNNDPQNRKK